MFSNNSIFCTNDCALYMRFRYPVFCNGNVVQLHEIMLKNYFTSLLISCPKTVWNFSAVNNKLIPAPCHPLLTSLCRGDRLFELVVIQMKFCRYVMAIRFFQVGIHDLFTGFNHLKFSFLA